MTLRNVQVTSSITENEAACTEQVISACEENIL